LIQIIIEAIWYCRLLAIDDTAVTITNEDIEKEGEGVCDKASTSRNKLPPRADPTKHYYTTCIQLIVISRIVKSKIVMLRTSGSFARETVKLEEIVSMDSPLNLWKCKSNLINGLVNEGCSFYASLHSAFYYRCHPRVCCISNLLVQRYMLIPALVKDIYRCESIRQGH
jgi:hypothetical protein